MEVVGGRIVDEGRHETRTHIPVFSRNDRADEEMKDPLARAALLDHKRYLESRQADIESGDLQVKFQGPDYLLPEFAKQKRFY